MGFLQDFKTLRLQEFKIARSTKAAEALRPIQPIRSASYYSQAWEGALQALFCVS